MSRLSLRKKLALFVSVGVLLPLGVLTYLQYRSLAELEDKTKGAFKDNLRQGLTLVERLMKQRLEQVGMQTLSPIDNMHLSSDKAAEEREKYFADVKRSHPEIKDIFVFDYAAETQKRTIEAAYAESLFDKARLGQNFVDANRQYLFIHDACETCGPSKEPRTYLFHPLNDDATRDVVAGVLLTEDFVSNDLMGGTLTKIINAHHDNAVLPAIVITIGDENQRVLYSNATPQVAHLLETNFDRPFSNWRAAIGLKNTNLDELARNSFLHSAGATLLVLVFLIGGVALTIRATDREARLAQAKSNFVSNVSHELKTPLSLLSLFSEILELGRVNSEEKKTEYYGIIRHESLRLNKMIDNILDFSKIEAGRKTYVFAAADMAKVIEQVLSSYRYQITNSGFDVQTNIQPNLPPVVIDRDAIAQALSNLIDNAIKYSRDVKQLSLTLQTRGSDLAIEIADQGIGIPRSEQARIFEKFYRVGNGLVHDVKGSGLGLSLVKHIIEAHHGTISVASDIGKGTRFTILLPLAAQVADASV